MHRIQVLLRAGVALLALGLTTAGPAMATTHHAKPVRKPAHHSTPSKPKGSSIPQHNGGDHDSDNNGGPSDGDGNV
jgi:hypothetical protein